MRRECGCVWMLVTYHFFFSPPHTSPPWNCMLTSRTLVHPVQLLRRGQLWGREIALTYYDRMNITHTHTRTYAHAHSHNYIPTRIYTQRLSVKPIPPNGQSLILLTGIREGNEVCHPYIHDPWLTLLPHSPPPSWPGNGTLLGWEGETERQK